MSPARRRSLFEKLSASIPNPETELVHNNPFQLLISVILSAQATDVSVNKVTPSLFQAFPDPQSMGDAGHEQILRFIRSIGLAPSKAKNIEKTCKLLVEKHQGEIPQTLEELEALPGSRKKDGECHPQYRFWTCRDSGGYSHLPGFKSNRTCDGQECQGSRRWFDEECSSKIQKGCASSADFAWPVCLQGP